ncbi:hypothetical protein P691DRAFT_73061 [Macrolepiota fuliginosa MF-IS2]|uniref:Uncharacterized protein n=1 Tax=Macrolepiota fuliginosa MF-IS2 TaxID=1400762 RepID=A0A9P5WZR9_9AGAR|nr:hypothetical protein P691DRAFT_73061 [Macrolepiota fuliginosa MF-IS2]
MPTPSLVSDCPSGDAVAMSPPLFSAWMDGAKVTEIMIPPKEVADHFDELYQLKEVPKALQVPLLTSYLDSQTKFQLAVRTWASTLSSVEEDEYGILTALPNLAFAYDHVCKTSNNHSKEHTQRRSIEDIIELAFSARVDRHCDFKTEESYRLVASPGNPDAQSDTLVTIPSKTIDDRIRMDRFSFQGDLTISQHLYWSADGMTDGFSIIGFAGEFKKDANNCNKNQLIMVLATAQAQRKALSLNRSIIMGAISCRGRVQIFSSYWTSDESLLCIYVHEQEFDLSDPIQVIRLYVFCSKLEKVLQGTLASELKTWNTPTEVTLQSRKWRSPDHSRKRRRTEAGESGNGTNGGRGGGNNDLVDANEFDGDRYMNVMKWRDEVVKDGK